MERDDGAGRVVAHLVLVGFLGGVLTVVQLQAVLIALFAGSVPVLVVVCAVVAALSVALLAGVAAPTRPRPRGRWAWAAGVCALGTAGAGALVAVRFRVDGLADATLFYPQAGLCHLLAAALAVPRTWTRAAALGTAAVLAAGTAWSAWAAAQPPTLGQWLAESHVDRALLRVGEPPAGYALHAVGAGRDGFGVGYRRPGAPDLHLSVGRAGDDTRRRDTRGCPVPYGEWPRCAGDGGGRLLLAYEGNPGWQELWLRRDGLIHTVTATGGPLDLPAARRVLSTLRPATDAELADLVTIPVPR